MGTGTLETLRRLAGTVRFRITAVAVLVMLLVLVIAGIALLVVQREVLTGNLDEFLEDRADVLASLIDSDGATTVLDGVVDEDGFAQVVSAEGEVLSSVPRSSAGGPIAAAPPSDEQRLITAELREGLGVYRVLSRRVGGTEDGVVIHVAAQLDEVEESTGTLERSLAFAVPAATAVLAALVWWLVGRTLRPVEAIRSELDAIGGTDLNRRVPEPDGGDEIARLARTMNAMLERVEGAAQRQQRFVADASHELRSPLARIRSEVEVDIAHGDGADLAATHRSILEETIGLQRLSDDLLRLARSDAGVVLTEMRAVDLDDIVLREARRLRVAEGPSVEVAGVTAAQVVGDAHQLSRLVRNLVDNAARHAATMVTITLGEHGGAAVLTVADDGAGIPLAEHARVFERFARLDDARHAGSGGTGLGLAIAHDIVLRHGGTIRVDPDHRGARLVVMIPLGP